MTPELLHVHTVQAAGMLPLSPMPGTATAGIPPSPSPSSLAHTVHTFGGNEKLNESASESLAESQIQARVARAAREIVNAERCAMARAAYIEADKRAREEHNQWLTAEAAARGPADDAQRSTYMAIAETGRAAAQKKAQQHREAAAAQEGLEYSRVQAAAAAKKERAGREAALKDAAARAAEIAAAQEQGRRDTELALAAIKVSVAPSSTAHTQFQPCRADAHRRRGVCRHGEGGGGRGATVES